MNETTEITQLDPLGRIRLAALQRDTPSDKRVIDSGLMGRVLGCWLLMIYELLMHLVLPGAK
jgi:hypothetical protein